MFRFDDVSVNTDMSHLNELIATIRKHRPQTEILLAISSIVFSEEQFRRFRPEQQMRVHPSELTAMSNIEVYYQGTRCGLPSLPADVVRAGHGIAHVDHRLLGRKAQAMSILMSCALAQASIFVPPYNKYNQNTQEICASNDIRLVKWEDGWLHCLYNAYQKEHKLWYCHPYDFSVEQLERWFK